MRSRLFSICLVTLFSLAAPCARAVDAVRITGIFSDLDFHGEDLIGTEVFILGGSDGYVAMVQHWEGGSSGPIIVPVRINGDRITFTVPTESSAAGEFRGRVGKTGFDGIWRHVQPNGGYVMEDIHLPRRNSYWQ